MLYVEFVHKAINTVITEADNGLFYLEPLWRQMLQTKNLDINNISDYKTNWNEVEDILKLTVEKQNAVNSVTQDVMLWFYSIISQVVDPVVQEEETELIKQFIEHMKTKKE